MVQFHSNGTERRLHILTWKKCHQADGIFVAGCTRNHRNYNLQLRDYCDEWEFINFSVICHRHTIRTFWLVSYLRMPRTAHRWRWICPQGRRRRRPQSWWRPPPWQPPWRHIASSPARHRHLEEWAPQESAPCVIYNTRYHGRTWKRQTRSFLLPPVNHRWIPLTYGH